MKTDPVSSIPSYNAPTETWISWHKSLKDNFGKKVGNQVWLKGWGIRGSSGANTRDLREYLSKNGLKISESGWDKVVDLGGDTMDFFGNILKMGKITGLVVGGSLLLVVLYALFNMAKSPAQSINTAMKVA